MTRYDSRENSIKPQYQPCCPPTLLRFSRTVWVCNVVRDHRFVLGEMRAFCFKVLYDVVNKSILA